MGGNTTTDEQKINKKDYKGIFSTVMHQDNADETYIPRNTQTIETDLKRNDSRKNYL